MSDNASNTKINMESISQYSETPRALKSSVSDSSLPALTQQKLREWIIAAEILGKPRCKRRFR